MRFLAKIVIVCYFGFFVFSIVRPGSALAGEECAQLVLARCESCHYKTRICEKLGNKSRSSWKRTVKNMVRYGAKMTDGEIKQMVRCLSGPAEDVALLCGKK
ncbi:MAG: hypothetical protein V1706_13100 [Pseudomonadota bacterium]